MGGRREEGWIGGEMHRKEGREQRGGERRGWLLGVWAEVEGGRMLRGCGPRITADTH